MVIARLYANAQHHLRKLKSAGKKGRAVNLKRYLTEVTNLLPSETPRGVLSLQEQGRFALGFYHQKAHRATERAAAKRRREEAATNTN